MGYTSAQVKLRLLAQQNAALIADLAATQPPPAVPFRWFDRQLWPGQVANPAGGACVSCTQAGNIRQGNQSGIGNLEWPRLTLTVYGLDSETVRSVTNDLINFMETVDLCSNAQFGSPQTAPNPEPGYVSRASGRDDPESAKPVRSRLCVTHGFQMRQQGRLVNLIPGFSQQQHEQRSN